MHFFILLVTVLALTSNVTNAADKEKTPDKSLSEPAQVEADSMQYDDKKSVVTATGNVEVTQGGRKLVADKVTYDRINNLINADGNISLTEPNGNILFADSLQLKDDLKQGSISKVRAQFTDQSNMTATQANRVNENKITLDDVTYTPCSICKDDPKKAPLWRVRAKKATINQAEQTVKYNNAFFEVKNVPVLYTPYLSHPTPDADRKSGFLIPKYATDRVFGASVKVPYYYNIAPNKDLTLAPIFTAKEGAIMSGEFRHLVETGTYRLEASATNPDKVDINGNVVDGNKVRGHVEGNGDFDLDDKWSWGFNAKRSTDDTYLRKYNFGEEDVLTSRLYSTAIEDRNYVKAEAISFQGLKTNDDPGQTPLILPNTNAHYESAPGFSGSRWTMDGNLLSLTRDEGVSSNRISAKGGWKLPHITKSGHVLEFNTSLRGDGYLVDDVPEDPSNPTTSPKLDGLTSRVIPQAELKWALPLVRKKTFLEPTVKLIASPYGGNPDKIYNEDSQDVEFSDENVFDANHFTGFDRIENGPRMNYGMRGGMYDIYNGDVNFMLGQNYRTKEDRNFSASSGLDSYFSDYVGMVGYNTQDRFNIAYRFRVDNDGFSLNRNAVTTGLNIAHVKFNADYIAIDDSFDSTNGIVEEKREIFIANSTVDVSKHWEVAGSGHRNLESGDWVATKANLLYKGDCIHIGLELLKEFTRDRDIRPNTTVSLQISLKNLGY